MKRGQAKARTYLDRQGSPARGSNRPVLLEDASKSYQRRSGSDTQRPVRQPPLIFGDNLLALKALEAEFAGTTKCIYIDPPYNTGSAL